MVKYFIQHKLVLALILVLVLMTVFVSACNLINLGGETATAPTTAAILAPADNTKVLLHSPIQIQSAHPGDNVTRVELSVAQQGSSTEKLIRADVPTNGIVLQEWLPEQTGVYTIRVRSYDKDNHVIVEQTRTYDVVDDTDISLAPIAIAETSGSTGATQPTVIPLTPLPISPGAAASGFEGEAVIQVVATSTPESTATPIPRYPPPPPIPGIPPGPVQYPGLNVHPPVCDDAKYLGPFASNTSRRIVIKEADDLAPKAVGGTTVFRAWRLQNVGTCTWGPGYELAFYGGRSMGSGGVAFEQTWPGEPARRNVIIDNNRLVVPAGKPNQVAVVEVELMTPVTPGIHQSYWRMRNPHGVFFGPIIGVTMEVVRDCAFGIYGAPVINRFEILGYGNVYRPTDPTNIVAEVGKTITLDYNIISATNFDIVFEDPTGGIQSVSSSDPSGRVSFPAQRLGRNTITLYADNGSCTAQAQVNVDVIPRVGEQFELDIILASSAPVTALDEHVKFSDSVAAGTVRTEWHHYDPEIDDVRLHVDSLRRGATTTNCLVGNLLCSQSSEWQGGSPIVTSVSNKNEGTATIQGQLLSTEIPAAGQSQADARMSDLEQLLRLYCRSGVEVVRYHLEARKDGQAATPQFSNTTSYACGRNADTSNLPSLSSTAGSSGSSSGFSNSRISSAGFSTQSVDQSCSLALFGHDVAVPFACGDVPIVGGVGLVLLLAVGLFFFK